jgi:hypothetical protein
MVTTSSTTSTEPDVNFYGTLEDHSQTALVESVLIGGKYESIPVYQEAISSKGDLNTSITPTEDIDPKQNKTLINLQDIRSITLQHPNNPAASSIKVNNKVYIQIIVESVHGTKKKYLVESTRKITCKEIDKSSNEEGKPTLQNRDLNFIHVKKLTLKGYKSNHTYQAPNMSPISKESEKSFLQDQKKDFKNNAADLLHAIEDNVKNMSSDNPTTFETMRSTILTLLKSLRDQLQKFLDMIK